jgi:hypothetical protein
LQTANALGDRERLLAVKTLLLEGTGSGNLLFETKPQAALRPFAFDYRFDIDLGTGRWRVEKTRTSDDHGPLENVVFGSDGTTAYS